ncbi:MAG TPA: hypothetical protein VFW38_13575 [Solirubrobacteraceae bacterium]|nr:hypothetical protein [Solirubrobacteraceae bacterium]
MAATRRRLLLASHSRDLSWDELEDCYSQATFEMLMRARSRGPFRSDEHIAHALEQRLCSRIDDRHRARGGRSPGAAALAHALPLALCDRNRATRATVDERADVERIVLQREELGRIARYSRRLTQDQRLLLHSQIGGEQTPAAFCTEHNWSLEKYRKVGQRARARLLGLLSSESVVPVVLARRISGHGPACEATSPTT